MNDYKHTKPILECEECGKLFVPPRDMRECKDFNGKRVCFCSERCYVDYKRSYE